MKIPNLIDVPPTSPYLRKKLKAFMAVHGIETHNARFKRDDHPWSAIWLTKARTIGCGNTSTSTMFDCVANSCRVLDESGFLVTGRTELDAVRTLCENCGIPFDP